MTEFEYDLLKKRSIGPLPQTRAEYLAMIKKLEKIIDGHTTTVKRELKKRMQTLSRQKQYETAAKVRDQIKWLDIFANRQKIVSAKEYLEAGARAAPLAELQTALNLKTLPERIEGYDISNIQGQWSVGAMAVFTNGEADKKEYRKFKIKTVKGANDFAMLSEIIKRRFKHDEWPKPDLILLDGGKGQLSTVLEALFACHPGGRRPIGSSLKKMDSIASLQNDGLTPNNFIALAKQREEIFQGPDLHLVNLTPTTPAARLLQRIRDEAHRFGQAYYHTRHAKANIKSRLDEIPGIGPKTKKVLITRFGSLQGVRQASRDDIIKIIGKVKAEKLLENL